MRHNLDLGGHQPNQLLIDNASQVTEEQGGEGKGEGSGKSSERRAEGGEGHGTKGPYRPSEESRPPRYAGDFKQGGNKKRVISVIQNTPKNEPTF